MNDILFKGIGMVCIYLGCFVICGFDKIYNFWDLIFKNMNYIEIDFDIIIIEIYGDIGYVILVENVM